MQCYVPIAKLDNGQRLVYGIATAAIADDQPGVWDGQKFDADVVDVTAIRDALPDYMAWANIREMHGDRAAGTALDALQGEDGRTYLIARVVDDSAWRKVRQGVYKGFSIAGRVLAAVIEQLPDGRIVRRILKLLLTEISLVDRPANPEAAILVFKRSAMADDGSEERAQDAPDALEQLAAMSGQIRKAAADPMKAVALIQQLRNDAELAGDLEGADRYTQAIGLLMIGAGEADTEEADEAEQDLATDAAAEQAAGGAMPLAQRARSGDVQKVGRKIAASRLAMLKSALMTYAKALADAGDADAVAMLAAVQAPGEVAGAAKAIEAALQKGLQPVAQTLLAMHEMLSRQPIAGGPVARFAGQPIAKRLADPATQPAGTRPAADADYVAQLRRLVATESHAGRRAQYEAELAKLAGE